MTTFDLPDLGEGLQEAEIVSWHVSPGDHVVADQPLLSVETDKAVVEIPSPQSGRIAKVFGEVGDFVQVGSPLVEFEEGTHADTGTVVGEISAKTPPAKAAPSVRALAKELGVELKTIAGSGPGGAVTRSDVEQAVGDVGVTGEAETLRGVRRAMADKMTRAGAETVPATLFDDADLNAWPAGGDISYRLIRAVAAGCKAAPSLNAWYDGRKKQRRVHETVNLGLAMNTRDGLFVPVLNDVGNRNAADLRKGVDRLKGEVAMRKIPPEDLRGQTITLSNFGMIAGRHSAMVIIPPQVAILGAGRVEPRAVAKDGKPAVHKTLPLSLTFDHRAVTGAEAGAFLDAVIKDLEKMD